jgi:hypothetical protein
LDSCDRSTALEDNRQALLSMKVGSNQARERGICAIENDILKLVAFSTSCFCSVELLPDQPMLSLP